MSLAASTAGSVRGKEAVMTVRACAPRNRRSVCRSQCALEGISVNANFLWFTLFVGVNLFQSAFTNWCPMMAILRKGGLPDAAAPGTPITSKH